MYTNDVIKKNYSSISILPKRNVFYFFLFLPSGLSFPGCACIDTRARFKKALNLSLSCIIKELIYIDPDLDWLNKKYRLYYRKLTNDLNGEIDDLEYKYKKLEEENEKLKEDIERLA
jgi:hypothetical protein